MKSMKVTYRIKEVAEVRGLSYREISKRCGMASPGLSQIVKGQHGTSVDLLLRIAQALEVPYTVLLDVTDDDGNAIACGTEGRALMPTYCEWILSEDGHRRLGDVDGMGPVEHRGRPRKEADDDTPTKWQKKPRIRLAEPVHDPNCRGRNRLFATSEEVVAIEEAAKALLR